MLSATDRDYLRRREAEEREAAEKAADGARLIHLELARLYASRLGHRESDSDLRVAHTAQG
jgi:hypothetical protein